MAHLDYPMQGHVSSLEQEWRSEGRGSLAAGKKFKSGQFA